MADSSMASQAAAECGISWPGILRWLPCEFGQNGILERTGRILADKWGRQHPTIRGNVVFPIRSCTTALQETLEAKPRAPPATGKQKALTMVSGSGGFRRKLVGCFWLCSS